MEVRSFARTSATGRGQCVDGPGGRAPPKNASVVPAPKVVVAIVATPAAIVTGIEALVGPAFGVPLHGVRVLGPPMLAVVFAAVHVHDVRPLGLAIWISAGVCFCARAAALTWNLSLPRRRGIPGEEY